MGEPNLVVRAIVEGEAYAVDLLALEEQKVFGPVWMCLCQRYEV